MIMMKKMLEQSLGGKIFSAQFVKKDNTIRKIKARLGVTKHLKGGSKGYDYDHLLTVWDLDKKAYRTINLDTLLSLKCGKINL